jgi:hypothetical protein
MCTDMAEDATPYKTDGRGPSPPSLSRCAGEGGPLAKQVVGGEETHRDMPRQARRHHRPSPRCENNGVLAEPKVEAHSIAIRSPATITP